MKRQFFIYSLPRSGSSWLSVFLSQPGSYCYHEPLADGSWQSLLDRIEARPEQAVGAIDTTAHQRQRSGLDKFQKFVLHRDKTDVLASLRRRGWTLELDKEIERLKEATRDCMPIYYRWLNDLGYLRELWIGLTDQPFDSERTEFLVEMNIQRTFASVKQRWDRVRALQ